MKILVKLVSMAALSISVAYADGSTRYGLGMSNTSETLSGFGYRPSNKWMEALGGQVNCNQSGMTLKAQNLFRLSSDIEKPMGVFSCTSARFRIGARFTTEACQNAISCRNNLENSGVDVKAGSSAMNDLIALDFIKNAMIMHSDNMERFQVMKKFAQEKFDKKLGQKCMNRFTTKGMSQCTGTLMEKAFEERQKECDYGLGCYKNDDKELGLDSFANYKKKNDDQAGNLIRGYFSYRSETSVKKRLSDDDKRVEAIAALATNADFKKAKQEQKIALIIEAIGRDSNNRLKDPILGFEFGNDNPANPSNADKFKEIIKMLESKTASTDFAKSFDNYRKKLAETRLGGENSCGQTNTMINICNEATLISQGKVISKDAETAEDFSSDNTSKIGIDYDLLKSSLGSKFDELDYNNLLDARRCVAFGITDDFGNPKWKTTKEDSSSTGTMAQLRMNQNEARGVVDSGSPSDSDLRDNGTSTSLVDRTGLSGLKGPTDEKAGATSTASTEDIVSEEISNLGQYSNGIGQTPAAQIGSNFADMYNASNFEAFAAKPKVKVTEDEVKPEEAQSTASTSASQDRMNEYLMKKLAAAEENLEKLKAETAEADEERAKQKKMDEEAALIKDLKGQIADLKTQTAKNAERKIASESAAEEARVSSSNNGNSYSSGSASISASRAEAPTAKVQATEKFDAAPAPSQAPQSSASRSGSSSGAILSSVSNADGSKTTTLGSGLVVTTVDGMSSEKAQQTISNRILELNGTPFYIEEGGMVKEIIAVVKDGKVLLDEKGNPIFEKIVKGKVGDKKFASKAKDKKDRVPASITDAADLKRDQEEKLKRERAEYMKLKNLTNGALKKK